MPMINIEDSYILDNTGQQVDDAVDYGLFNSNENLLDNAYFVGGGSQLGDGVFPINQRGQTSYSNGTNTTIDRWKTEASSISVDADGLTWTATGDNNQFEQIIENYKLIEGETYTATIDCDILAGSARLFVGGVGYPWPTVAGSAVNVSSGITKVTFTFARESGYTGQYKLALASVGSCTAKLRKFKLEKGTISTLANDAPPKFRAELANCQQYLYIPTFPWYAWTGTLAMATSATEFNWVINTPVPMRQGVIPTIGITGSVYINNTAVSNLTTRNYPVGNLVKISGTSAGMTNGQLYPVNTSADNVSVILSAEL